MLFVVTRLNAREFEAELDEMFALRHKVLAEHLKWDVSSENGRERDEFDDGNAIYLMCQHQGAMVGVIRFVHSMLPTLSSEIFSSLFTRRGVPREQDIYDGSRFCVDPETPYFRMHIGELMVGMAEFGRHVDLSAITSVNDYEMFRRYAASGLPTYPLGLPEQVGEGTSIVATSFEMSEDVVELTQKTIGYFQKDLISEPDVRMLKQFHAEMLYQVSDRSLLNVRRESARSQQEIVLH